MWRQIWRSEIGFFNKEKTISLWPELLFPSMLGKPSTSQVKAAEGLLKQFLQRHDLSLRTRTSVAQNLPEDLKRRMDVFYRHVSILRMETDFEFVVNMDETAVFFDTVPSHTIAKKGAKRVVIRSTGGRETPPDRCPCCNIVWNNTSTARHLQR